MADLTGRGRTVLPAAYLAEHVEYGWASTIDAAQGATADLGVVLVRPGMDREHLYVAMTRGRHGNHAYVTPDPTTDDDNHDHGHGQGHQRPSGAVQDPEQLAVRVLAAALGQSGAQDAAHTALEHARAQAVAAHAARQHQRAAEQAAERAAALEAAAKERQPRPPRPLLPEHARAIQDLAERRAEREQLRTERETLHSGLHQTRQELEGQSRWARGRRRALTETIGNIERELLRSQPTLASVDAEIDRLTRQVTHHSRQHQASDLPGPHRPRPGAWDLGRTGGLTQPWPTPAGGHDLTAIGLPRGREPYRGAERDLDRGLSR